MDRQVLYLTCGLPRSGKSTWARKVSRRRGWPIVCPDAVRLALHDQHFVLSAEPYVWAIVSTMARALFHAGHDRVILDAVNNTAARRREWVDLLLHGGGIASTRLVYFPTSAAECKARAEKATRYDLLDVIDRMSAEHEPPDASEGFMIVEAEEDDEN